MNKFLVFLLLGLLPAVLQAQKASSQLGQYQSPDRPGYKNYKYLGQYIQMADSVGLAADVFVPKGLEKGKQVPTIVYFVRYGRSLALKFPFKLFKKNPFLSPHVPEQEIRYFIEHGYACMIVDARGTGASFGSRYMEFSPQEVDDMRQVLDWICLQPWSSGEVGTTGISYTGTTAELVLATKHPSLKAAVVRGNIFDLYEDMVFPGGIRQAPFIKEWKRTTNALDESNYKVFGGVAKLAVKSVNPVPKHKKELKKALREHEANYDIFAGLFRVEARDDIDSVNGLSADDFSVHNSIAAIEASGVPIYRISGWYDGANIASLFKGYLNSSNTKRILVGPWDHGPAQFISPFQPQRLKVEFDVYSEILRFFDHYIKGIENGIDKENPVHYYQMGAEEYRSASAWPLPNSRNERWSLSPEGQLSPEPQACEPQSLSYTCNYQIGTGGGSRWNSLTGLFRYEDTIAYPERSACNANMRCFDSQPLKEALEITGHALVNLRVSSPDSADLMLFVYLEDIAPDGRVQYITEGQLRLAHRPTQEPLYKYPGVAYSFLRKDMKPLRANELLDVPINFLPISYRLGAGHRLRLSVGAADKDHFELPKQAAQRIDFHFGEAETMYLNLPTLQQEGK